MTPNEIYLNKSRKVLLTIGQGKSSKVEVATVMYNIESLGFIFSEEVFKHLLTYSTEQLTYFAEDLTTELQIMVGDHVVHRPMYPNFPKQVLEATDAELYLNAQHHYWSAGRTSVAASVGYTEETWVPSYPVTERPDLEEPKKKTLKVIGLGSELDFLSIFTKLVGANSSISQYDKDIIDWFVEHYPNTIKNYLPETIPYKEQLGVTVKAFMYFSEPSELYGYVKTATDVLRIAVCLSNGDVSLATNTKFVKFKRIERRDLLNYLENCTTDITEDMLRHKGKWIKLLHGLHIGDYKSRFPKSYAAAQVLRNNEYYPTFNKLIEKAIIHKSDINTVCILSDRPGEFARRLDKICRSSSNPTFIVNAFEEVVGKVSTPVLLQVYNHFKTRDEVVDRVFFPKGEVAKVKIKENKLDYISLSYTSLVCEIIKNTLVQRFSKLEFLGKVYIEPKLENYIVPFSQRSASKTLETITRGSKVDIGIDSTLRFFIYWKNGFNRTDLDLSALFLKEDFTQAGTVSYYDLRNEFGHHSGDITDAPNGASEFIDIDIKHFYKQARYVVMTVNSFTNQPYKDLPICFAGWMTRNKPNSGEIFEPTTVVNKFDLTAESQIAIPVVFDLKERKAIWTDLSLKAIPYHSNNVASNLKGIGLYAKAITTMSKPNIYDLLEMHAKGRGKIVTTREGADTVFDETFAKNIDEIMSIYMK